MAKIDLNQIGLFTRVVDSGSFTRAAEQLALPTSSVSRGVARLERDLGTRLLQRTTRRLQLTDAGKRFYEEARAALGALEQASESAASGNTDARGTVRVTAPSDIGDAFLAETLTAFRREHPHVSIEVTFTNRRVDLVEEGFDLALRAGKLADSSLVGRKVADTQLAIFAAPSYLARRGTPSTLADLADHDCVLFERMRSWSLEGPHGVETVRPPATVIVDSMSFLTSLVEAGAGIGLVPIVSALGASFGKTPPSNVRVLPAYVLRSAQLSLLWPASPFMPLRVILLRDYLTERLRQHYATCTETLGVVPVAARAKRRRR